VIKEIFKALDYSNSIIISPDFDGLLSAAIINKHKPIKISGIYNTNKLLMLDNSNPKDSVWVDLDIRQDDIVSIGCHAVYPEIKVNELSFNPHRVYEQHPDNSFKGGPSKTRDKFPFSTSVVLAHAYEWFPEDIQSKTFLAHADSGYIVCNDYRNNVNAWANDFNDRNIEMILNTDPRPMYNALENSGYKGDSFQRSKVTTSNEGKYINNIRLMANFINKYIPMPVIQDIVSTTRFASKTHEYKGNIDSDSLKIVDGSFSYAVIYGRYVSYTNGSI
jgi:hypothetical protein